ncbi:Mss4-like protein [Biscogniauxia marginata]|nr:Mss4-like protein [Biscogniauxia marginata]
MSSTTTMTRTGSCLCGGVKLRIEGEPFRTNLCHCTSCQKFSGAFCASLAVYKSEQVTITPTDPTLTPHTYVDTTPESGNVLERSFCGRCGSPLTGRRRGGDGSGIGGGGGGGGLPEELVAVAVGVVDGPKDDLRPQFEFFCVRRASWLGEVGGATAFPKLPPPPPQPPVEAEAEVAVEKGS